MAQRMKWTGAAAAVLTCLFALLSRYSGAPIWLSLSITSGTVFYHLGIRLLIGCLYDKTMGSSKPDSERWFHVSAPELAFYQKLKVRFWKRKMPTYDGKQFDPTLQSWKEIVWATCRAERIHETNMVVSFLPVLAAIWFGALPIFLVTSVLAAGYDGLFVILQRYNRARIVQYLRTHPSAVRKSAGCGQGRCNTTAPGKGRLFQAEANGKE